MGLRRLFVVLAAVVVLLLGGESRALAYVPPALTGAVNDGAGLLTAEERAGIEKRIAEHRKAHGNEVVVFIVPLLGAESIEDVAHATFNTWKIGRSGKDDGVLLVIAPNERKTRIETGKGVGGAITDLQSKRILSERVGPRLREGKAFEAISAGVESIISLLLGGPLVPDGGAPIPLAVPTAPRRATPTFEPTSAFVDGSGTFPASERDRYLKAYDARVRAGKSAVAVIVLAEVDASEVPGAAGWNMAAFRDKVPNVKGIAVVSRNGTASMAYSDHGTEGPARTAFEDDVRGLRTRVSALPEAARPAAMVDGLIEAQSKFDVPIPGFYSKHEEVLLPALVLGLIFVVIGFMVWLVGKLGIKGGGGGGGGGSSYGGSSYGNGSSSGGGSSYSGGSSSSGGSSGGGGGYTGGGGSSGGGGASDSY